MLRILLTLVFLSSTFSTTPVFAQLNLKSYFLTDAELEEYINIHTARELYTEIHTSKSLSKPEKKYMALAEVLVKISNQKRGSEKKSLLDSALHCAQKVYPNIHTELFRFPSYTNALGNYYKEEGQYALALKLLNPNPILSSIPITSDRDLLFRISIIELYMKLNNTTEVNNLLPHIIQYATSKKKVNANFLWNNDLLEKILLFNESENTAVRALGSKHIHEITEEKTLKKLNKKIERLSAKKIKSAELNLLKNQRNQTLEQAIKWHNVQKQYDSVIYYAQKLLHVTTPNETLHSFALFNIGKSYEALQNLDSAHLYYKEYQHEKLLELDHTYEIVHFYTLVQPDLKLATTYLDEALNLSRIHLSNLTHLSFEDKRSFVDAHKKYIDLIATIAHKHASEGAFLERLYDLLLFAKAAQLNSSQKLNNISLYAKDTTLTSLHKRWRILKHSTITNQDSINLYYEIEKKLTERLEILEHNTQQELTWKSIAQTLLPQEAAVEIIRYDDLQKKKSAYAALIITAEERTPKLIALGDASLLEKRYYNYYINCVKNQLKDTISYGKFWEPIALALGEHRKIYISPDGVYYKINVNTLLHNTNQFLLDEAHVSHVFSTRYLLPIYAQKVNQPSTSSEFFLIGSPDFSGSSNSNDRAITISIHAELLRNNSFDYLPGAKEEINLINTYLTQTKAQTTAWIDQDASESNLKKIKSPKVLHIATHGFFFEDNASLSEFEKRFNKPDPMRNSGLLLSEINHPLKEEDGIFTAYEAMHLDLVETDMVILSACETGLGEIQNGEGVFGLQRGFKIAGTKYLIMSLWKVNDAITQELMTDFYTLWNSGLSVSQAFHLAQLNTKKKYIEPHYWGGFILL